MKTIQWFLLLTRCHFQPLVTFGHSWLEMTPRESQKPFHFLNSSVDKQILICTSSTSFYHFNLFYLSKTSLSLEPIPKLKSLPGAMQRTLHQLSCSDLALGCRFYFCPICAGDVQCTSSKISDQNEFINVCPGRENII